MHEATLTIGEVARRAGLKTSAIRYYESVGLLPEAPRESGQRRYGDDTLRRLQVIDVAKRAGFSLDEARVLLATRQRRPAGPRPAAGARRAQAARGRRAHRARPGDARVARRRPAAASCETLDVCGLFDAPADGPPVSGARARIG